MRFKKLLPFTYSSSIVLVTILVSASPDITAQNRQLVGLMSGGGLEFGTIFSIPVGGNSVSQVKFLQGEPGKYPIGKPLEINGKFYGVTHYGGPTNYQGAIFEFDKTSGTYTTKGVFDSIIGNQPCSDLLLTSSGRLIGTTGCQCTDQPSALYEFDITKSTFSKLFDFTTSYNGDAPGGALLEAANGKLYGAATYGGADFAGMIFEYDLANNRYTPIIELTDSLGSRPCGALVQASNGKLYGMTREGGSGNFGTLFEYDISTDIFTKKIDFDSINGSLPYGSLFEAGNGKLYGTTQYGGLHNQGVLFEYDYSANSFAKKADLQYHGYATGRLTEVQTGKLYGTKTSGIFEYDYINNVFSDKHYLYSLIGYMPDGLLNAANGKLYGFNYVGGANNGGTIFEYDYLTDQYTNIHDFGSLSGGLPSGSLTLASNGKCYGITNRGGVNGHGVIFEFDYSSNSYIKRIDLNDSTGSLPFGKLVEGSNGKLYGMMKSDFDSVSMIEYDPVNHVYTKKVTLPQTFPASVPFVNSLVHSSNGKLYGMTYNFQSGPVASIFEYDYNSNSCIVKFEIPDSLGREPKGALIEASNGKFYGVTYRGGRSNRGVIFEYDNINNVYTKLIDLNDSLGSYPENSLIQATNGRLYGMTAQGGALDGGVIYEIDPTTSLYQVIHIFDKWEESHPRGKLLEASNGKLYGTTYEGGNHFVGVVFEFDPITHSYRKVIDLDPLSGFQPLYDQFLEIDVNAITTWADQNTLCNGSSLQVSYSTPPALPGNIFNVQLSDSSGSFTSPIIIGSIAATGNGKISCTIPSGTPSGSAYRVRVVGSLPVRIGNDNDFDIAIKAIPTLSVSCILLGPDNCDGKSGSAKAVVTEGSGHFIYQWSLIGNYHVQPVGPRESTLFGWAGNYTVTVDDLVCGQASSSIQIPYGPPPITSILSAPAVSCSGGSDVIVAAADALANGFTWYSRPTLLFNSQPGPYTSYGNAVNLTYLPTPPGNQPSWDVCVKAFNDCGLSIRPACTTIRSALLATGAIQGPELVSPGTIETYTVPSFTGANAFHWTTTGTDISASGSGNIAAVSFGPSFSSGTLCVAGVDACGIIGPARCIEIAQLLSSSRIGMPYGASYTYLFPNPAHDALQIRFQSNAGNHAYTLNISDLSGRLLRSENGLAAPGDNLHTIDLSGLAKGVYLLNLKFEGGGEVLRVVVE